MKLIIKQIWSIKKKLTALTVVLILTMALVPVATHAAAWHRGTPTVLRGNWKSNARKEATANGTATVYYTLSFSKTSLANSATINNKTLRFKIHQVDYQKIRKGTYLIRTQLSNQPASVITVKKTSKNKIIVGNGAKNTNRQSYYKIGH